MLFFLEPRATTGDEVFAFSENDTKTSYLRSLHQTMTTNRKYDLRFSAPSWERYLLAGFLPFFGKTSFQV